MHIVFTNVGMFLITKTLKSKITMKIGLLKKEPKSYIECAPLAHTKRKRESSRTIYVIGTTALHTT